MSYLTIKHIKGNPYLYQVRSERRGNRIVQVFEKYLGRADKANKVNKDILEYQISLKDKPESPVKPHKTKHIKHEQNQIDANWQILRSLIYGRDNGICWICRKFVPLHEYDLGHLIDGCNGGLDDYDNLVVMHKKCNQAKPLHNAIDEHITWLLKTRLLKDKTITRFGII